MDKRVLIYMMFLAISFYLVQKFLTPKRPKVLEKFIESPAQKELEKKESQIENFYVLEDEYQQLVFSDLGGSIAEINLPINSKGLIKPIEFDKIIEKSYRANSYFPQKPYFTFGFKKNDPQIGNYYPLLRRSIYNENKTLLSSLDPQYYGFNIQHNDLSLSKIKFKVVKFEKNLIEFEGNYNNAKIIKTYSLSNAPFSFAVKIKIDGELTNAWMTTGVPDIELISNAYQPVLKYRTLRNGSYVTQNLSNPKNITEIDQYFDWVSNSNGYFGIIVDSLNDKSNKFRSQYIQGLNVPTRISIIDKAHNLYPPQKYPGYCFLLPLLSNQDTSYNIYAGPYVDKILQVLDELNSKPLAGYDPDYLSVKTVKGWFSFASEPFSQFLLLIMKLFYFITHSWGFSIILLTVVFRIMLYPLNSWSIRSTLKMQEITPLLKVIDAKYKKDPKQANLEKMKLFKEKGANPLSGCLPILIQLPFLFGMFNLLKSTFQLRGDSFIPGWIDNLTAPDTLFSWSYPLFFIGTQFHLLPVALGLVMYVQSKMNLKLPEDRSLLTDQHKQQIIMTWAMPLLFTILFYNAASGLNIYFFFSMLLGILQQWYMTKVKDSKSIKLVKK